MTLTSAGGPLGSAPLGRFVPPIAPGTVYVEPHPRRVEAMVDGVVVVSTERVHMVHRPGEPPAYAFHPDDIGELPTTPEPAAPGLVRVPWDVAEWTEEGRRLVHYPPNPYHRVDCRPTTRRLRVVADGLVIVDTDDTVALFETGITPRLYVDPRHVRVELSQSPTTTYCNYKGWATYWSLGELTDIAWSYDEPLPESSPIAGFLSFDDTASDSVEVSAELPLVESEPSFS